MFSANYPWIPNHEQLKLEKVTCHMYINHVDMSHVTWIPNYEKMKKCVCIKKIIKFETLVVLKFPLVIVFEKILNIIG